MNNDNYLGNESIRYFEEKDYFPRLLTFGSERGQARYHLTENEDRIILKRKGWSLIYLIGRDLIMVVLFVLFGLSLHFLQDWGVVGIPMIIAIIIWFTYQTIAILSERILIDKKKKRFEVKCLVRKNKKGLLQTTSFSFQEFVTSPIRKRLFYCAVFNRTTCFYLEKNSPEYQRFTEYLTSIGCVELRKIWVYPSKENRGEDNQGTVL